MTETEWLRQGDPDRMIAYLQDRVGERKLRLLACAYARHSWELLTDPRSRKAVLDAEEFADGRLTAEALQQAEEDVRAEYTAAAVIFRSKLAASGGAEWQWTDQGRMAFAPLLLLSIAFFAAGRPKSWSDEKRTPAWLAACDAQQSLSRYLFESAGAFRTSHPNWASSCEESRRLLAGYIYEIIHNPFRPIAVEPSWLTSDVLALATGIYQDRAFDRLPILADALEDAGCDSPEVLDHCRGPGPHVRGCWLVDALLGKR